RQDAALVVHDSGGGFIAGGLDTQNDHWLSYSFKRVIYAYALPWRIAIQRKGRAGHRIKQPARRTMPFLTRLKTSLYRAHYKYLSGRQFRIGKCKGAEFVLWPGNYVDRRIWVEGIYEPEQIKTMIGYAQDVKPDIFLD